MNQPSAALLLLHVAFLPACLAFPVPWPPYSGTISDQIFAAADAVCFGEFLSETVRPPVEFTPIGKVGIVAYRATVTFSAERCYKGNAGQLAIEYDTHGPQNSASDVWIQKGSRRLIFLSRQSGKRGMSRRSRLNRSIRDEVL